MARGQLDKNEIKKDRDEVANRSSYLRFKDPGEYLVFIGPPQEGHRNVYVACPKHFSLGKNGKASAPCLDLEKNEILNDPRVYNQIDGGLDALHGGCAECEKVDAAATEPGRKAHRARQQFVMNMALVAKRPSMDSEWSYVTDPRLSIAEIGSQLWDFLTKIVYEHGEGVCNPEAAMLVKIVRTGTGQNDTKYTAEVDVKTARNPHRFSEKFIIALDKGLEPGGANDLFRAVARNVKLPEKLRLLSNKVENDEAGEEEEGGAASATGAKKRSDSPPPCYQYEYGQEDDECGGCKFRGPCAKACGTPLAKKHRLAEGDVGFEAPAEAVKPETKPTKPKPAAKQPEPEPEVVEEVDPADVHEDPAAEAEGNDVDYLIETLGYTEDQVIKMSDETFNKVLDSVYPASATSILPGGKLALFADRLPTDHPEYQAPTLAPVEAEKPSTTTRRRRATPPADPKSSTPPEGAETPAAETSGTVSVLDKLERDLREKQTKRKKPAEA